MLFVVGRDDAQDRSEDLFLGDGRGVVDVAEDGRLDIPAAFEVLRPAAACGEGGALGNSLGDVALDPVPHAAHGKGAHLGLGVEGVADPDLGEGVGQRLDELVVAAAGDHDPGQRRADLPGQNALRPGEGGGRGAEVHIVEDHRRGLATELQGAAGHPLAAERGDAPAGGSRAGEGDLVDPRVVHQQL